MPGFRKRPGFGRRLSKRAGRLLAKSDSSSGKLPEKGNKGAEKPKIPKSKTPDPLSDYNWMSVTSYQDILSQARARNLKVNSLGDAMRQLGTPREKALQIFVEKLMAEGATQEEAMQQARKAMQDQYDRKM